MNFSAKLGVRELVLDSKGHAAGNLSIRAHVALGFLGLQSTLPFLVMRKRLDAFFLVFNFGISILLSLMPGRLSDRLRAIMTFYAFPEIQRLQTRPVVPWKAFPNPQSSWGPAA